MTAGARGEGRRSLGSDSLMGSEEQFQGSDRCPCPAAAARGMQFVLGCESGSVCVGSHFSFGGVCCLGKKPQRSLAAWPFPHFLGLRKQILQLFLKTKCQHLTAGVSI